MKIVSDIPLRVTTRAGTVALLEAGVPREFSDEIGLLAMQMGAKQVQEEGEETALVEEECFIEDLFAEVPDPSTVELVTYLERLMDEGNPDNFKQDGYPKAAIVSRAMGRTVDSTERNAAWESILNS